VEDIGNVGWVAVGGELVGYETGVGPMIADYVGEVEEGDVGMGGRWGCDVSVGLGRWLAWRVSGKGWKIGGGWSNLEGGKTENGLFC
jgi:hypothetical protein